MGRSILSLKSVAAPLLLATLFGCAPVGQAEAKGVGVAPAREGVALPGSPYRYVTLNPRHGDRIETVAMRIVGSSGRIDRRLRLRGQYYVPAVASDLRGGGLSADGRTLVLQRFAPSFPPPRSGFAVLDTATFRRYPARPGEERPAHAVRRIELRGFYSLRALSPDGKTAYLKRHLVRGHSIAGFEARALDLETGRLLPNGDLRKSEPEYRRSLVDLGRRLIEALAALAAPPADPLLAFARTPRRPGNLLARIGTVGRSAQGRPITLHQTGDPRWSGELLVFGCIHGDECAARGIKPTTGGCPDPGADIYVVPNLNPDGGAGGSRLNGRGVDLNRNFPSEWEPIQARWDPQYSGPRPFSEPESRLAARIIRRLRPEATVWFHQYAGTRPFVRAWGRSATAGRRFAELARMPFRLMRRPAGTAPNWQNHRFPDASSFVVELPAGRLEPETRGRLTKALVRMGRWVRED